MPAADPHAQAKAERANTLYDVLAAAQRWFEEQLGARKAPKARAYLDRRGIKEATRRRFGFGFAPDGRGRLKAALASFGNDKLVEAGLLIAPEGDPSTGLKAGREPYDRFRGRLTFPICDRRGRVIAFSARILGAGEPKYLNSPETPLFEKGRTLFNIDKAAAASGRRNGILVVEGQMDVIALAQAGIEERWPRSARRSRNSAQPAVAPRPLPILCFDGDAAGQKAAVRGALRALPHVGPGRSLGFVTMPAGQDPDDLVRSGGRAAV
jgi:DNA primase